LAALLADGPAAAHTDKLMQFGRLVGAWNMAIADETGTVPRNWVFGWVLQGRAIQDVLWDERTRLRGTTVQHYDLATDSWRITWFGPDDPAFVVGQARLEGKEIVIQTSNLDYRMRWIFSDVTPRSFRWRAAVQVRRWLAGCAADDGNSCVNGEQSLYGRARRWIF
jgi:hypothetical protein